MFEKYFNHNIKQLMYVYPLDKKKKDGKLFWTLPKRPPKEINFDFNDKLHKDFIVYYSLLLSKIWGIKVD